MKMKSIMTIVTICLTVVISISAVLEIKHIKSEKDILITSESDISQTDNTVSNYNGINIDKTDWRLILVNADHKLPDGYSVDTAVLTNGFQADSRCCSDLQQMLDDCRQEGLTPVVCSAYRTQEMQKTLFENQVKKQKAAGHSDEEAEIEAAKLVAVPGTSEHQTGLAFDIVDIDYQMLDLQQEKTAVQQWLLKNSWKYGFILRYPPNKSDITKFDYEPWHYRYVGKENAKFIYDHNLCLEEYLHAF